MKNKTTPVNFGLSLLTESLNVIALSIGIYLIARYPLGAIFPVNLLPIADMFLLVMSLTFTGYTISVTVKSISNFVSVELFKSAVETNNAILNEAFPDIDKNSLKSLLQMSNKLTSQPDNSSTLMAIKITRIVIQFIVTILAINGLLLINYFTVSTLSTLLFTAAPLFIVRIALHFLFRYASEEAADFHSLSEQPIPADKASDSPVVSESLE